MHLEKCEDLKNLSDPVVLSVPAVHTIQLHSHRNVSSLLESKASQTE